MLIFPITIWYDPVKMFSSLEQQLRRCFLAILLPRTLWRNQAESEAFQFNTHHYFHVYFVDVGQVTESLLQVPHQHTTPGNMVAWAG
jgi:hypothetical protein